MNIENKIEAILLFKNEPVSLAELAKLLEVPLESVRQTINNLQDKYRESGIVIVTDGEVASFGTHPNLSLLIEEIQRDEFSREIGKAGLETLAIVLYKGPVSRREIDYIRGVNSSYILRNLLMRGLVEKVEGGVGERGYNYKPTLELLRFLGVANKESLPGYNDTLVKIQEFLTKDDVETETE